MATHTVQLVAFAGCPPSVGQVARQALQKHEVLYFLCVLELGESSESVRRAWEFSVQPLSEQVHLVIVHEPRGRTFDGIADFASELMRSRPGDLDVLFLSEESSWRGSRRLARQLRALQEKLGRTVPNSMVGRV